MSRSGDHSYLVREVEPPSTPTSQVRTNDAIPPSSNRSFLSSVVDLFHQAKTNATNEFDQLYDSFSVPRDNGTPRKTTSPARQRVEKKYQHSTPSTRREKQYTTSLTPHFERQRLRESPRKTPVRQALSSSRSAKHWQKDTYQPNVDIDFQPNRSLTKTLEQAAVNESSLSHNPPSFISTSSNSRTRLDLDELDDELHRVARLDRNLDIVRQQVQALYTPTAMEYNEQESSFISRKSSFFDTENRANEPSTHETIFSEPQPRSKLLWSSSIASPDGNVFNTSDGTTGNKEASLVSRSSGLPALQISPVPKTRTLPARNTPSKPSAYRSIHQSPSSPYKSQQHPKRLLSKSPNPVSSMGPTLLQELASIKLRPTNTIRSPNGTIRTNKHWDEIQKSKRNSFGEHNLYDRSGTDRSSSVKGYRSSAKSVHIPYNARSPTLSYNDSGNESTNVTNFGYPQLSSSSLPQRSLHDELSIAGATFNNSRKAELRRSTILRRLDDSEVFSEENTEQFKHSALSSLQSPRTNIISGDEYTFQGQRFRVEEAISGGS